MNTIAARHRETEPSIEPVAAPGCVRRLERLVLEGLCQRADLDYSCPMIAAVVSRKGDVAAIEFVLFGSRSVRLSAVWDAAANKVHLYDQQLARFRTVDFSCTAEDKKTLIAWHVNAKESPENAADRTRSVWAAK